MIWALGTVFIAWIVCTICTLRVIPVEACVMMNGDWRPKSLENRTVLAPVVISGTVLRLRDHALTPPGGSGVYSAEVAVNEVYKGYPYFHKVSSLTGEEADGPAKVYLIEGFGSRDRCRAEVQPNEKYIMFLTAVPMTSGRETDGMRLIARYDDIFGAAVEFDDEQEKKVHRVVGWRDWASWTPCPVTCGDGVQLRRRMCVQDVPDACEGAAEQRRHCNSFKCQDVKDLLQLMSLSTFPPGVRRSPRRRAYHISSNAILKLPISTVYPEGFPEEFSILLVVKPPRYFSSQQNGYLYAMLVMGPDGGVQLGVQLSSSPALVYSRRDQATGKVRPDAVSFGEYTVLKRKWNVLAFSVRKKSVTLYADCTKEYQVDLKEEGGGIRVQSGSGDIAIGNPKPNMIDMYFEGDLEQLAIIADPDAAALQCSAPVGTFLAESVWPSVNITGDLHGGMDTPLVIPIPGALPKPDPPITRKDPTTTPILHQDIVESTNQGAPDVELAPEHELIPPITPGLSDGQTSTAAPLYNENNFDFVVEIFENSLANYGGDPSSPIEEEPIDIKFDSGNDILPMPERDTGSFPSTTPESNTEHETKRSYDEESPGHIVTEKEFLETTTTLTDLKTVESTTHIIKTTTTTTEPTSVLRTTPVAIPVPTTRPTALLTTLPTLGPTTVPTTTQPTKAPTIKLRLESAHRPDSWEIGHRLPNAEPGSDEEAGEVLENWSTWSTCSRTCGTGTRYRFSRCRPGSKLLDCKTGRGITAQTQTCHLSDCKAPSLKWSEWSMCSRTCGDGVEMRMAYCYDNKEVPGCESGQKTVVERQRCHRRHCYDVCTPSCKNGGVCGLDRKCNCPTGYLGDTCEIELCSHPCQNGGQCVAKNYCQCPSGFAPPRCTPVCNPRCQNGGTCVAPNECACSSMYTGSLCERVACSRPCENGGTCIGANTCSCRLGYQGTYCEQAICAPACSNGGRCVRPGFCRCPPAYRGPTCQIGSKTLNHASRGNQPSPPVPSNFARTRPSRRRRHHCKLRTSLVTYQRSYVKPVARTVKVRCGYWQPLLCTQTRMGYEAAYRIFYRISYRRECASNGQ
ncbi:uncharacterized protein LOC110976450 isoform X2 [Acanthaster planci]|uniref:Uncharacterized protein LOC110976450 isoform X2 n=1 Tax=Acanthaster planci TaxID=133434 RepID=A0A8B7XZG2_ACAPL|nr:uncharacterized protein LOC110976450 isoform X2 [Acanthaster planci]